MANLNLKANTPEEQIILKHLIPQVSEMLAEKINNGVRIQKGGKTLINKKDLSTFMDYLYEEARKRIPEKARHGKQCVGMEGEDIIGIAIHYFEEDSIEGKLYNEDGTEYQPPKPVKKNTTSSPSAPATPHTPTKPAPKPQLNIFDMLADNTTSETPPKPIVQEQPKPEPKKGSPMYQHFLAVKEKYNDCIVFYRLGDFYEMFGEDAVTAAKELDLTLTGRDCGLDERVPMTGIPFHAADAYISKLVKKNYKVAVCEPINGETAAERVITKQPEDNRLVDVVTGEFLSDEVEELSVEEMRQFDGDLDEPEELITVSKLIGDTPDEEETDENNTPDLLNIPAEPDDDFDIEKERQKMKAFDLEAMIILQELFDNKITIV